MYNENMKLGLYTIGDRYSFSLDEFSSHEHFYLTANIKSSYKYAWQAYRDARMLASSIPSHIEAIKRMSAQEEEKDEHIMEISAEEMISQHYNDILSIIDERSKGYNDKQENDVIYGEIKSIVGEILKIIEQLQDDKSKSQLKEIISKFRHLVRERFPDHLKKDISEKEKEHAPESVEPPSPEEQYDPAIPSEQVSKSALNKSLKRIEAKEKDFADVDGPQDEDDDDEYHPLKGKKKKKIEASLFDEISLNIMEGYAQMACKALQKRHPAAIYHISRDNSITFIDSSSKSDLLKIQMNDELNVNAIYPLGEILEIYPSHSKEFYQRYWKPIVESIGHYALSESNIIYGKLPDIPEGKKDFNVRSSSNKTILKFATNIWELKAEPIDAAQETAIQSKNPSEYTEDDFKEDTIVECIVPELKSIFGKKGVVVQVIPLQSHIELDVQFLDKDRGIKRLTTDQIKIVNV